MVFMLILLLASLILSTIVYFLFTKKHLVKFSKTFDRVFIYLLLFVILISGLKRIYSVLEFNSGKKNGIFKNLREREEKGFALCWKLKRFDKKIRVFSLMSSISHEKNFGRISYVPKKNEYMAEIKEKDGVKLLLLNSEFQIEKVYNGLIPASRGKILGRASPDGKYFLLYGKDLNGKKNGVYILNIETGKFFQILKDKKFSKDQLNGNWFSWYGNDGVVFGELKKIYKKGCSLATYHLRVYVYFLKDGSYRCILDEKGEDIRYDMVVVSPDKRWLTYFFAGRVYIKDLNGKEKYFFNTCGIYKEKELSLLWSHDSRYLIFVNTIYRYSHFYGGEKPTYIKVWDAKSGKGAILDIIFRYPLFTPKEIYPFFINSKKIISGAISKSKIYFLLFIIISLLWILNYPFLFFYRRRVLGKISSENVRSKNLCFGILVLFLSGFLFITFFTFSTSYFLTFQGYSFSSTLFTDILNFRILGGFLVGLFTFLSITLSGFKIFKIVEFKNLKKVGFLSIFGGMVLTLLSDLSFLWIAIFSIFYSLFFVLIFARKENILK